jgi:hypothetical protein
MAKQTSWLWRMEDKLLHLYGPAQLGNRAEEARRESVRASEPVKAPAELIPGGWERRGTPGHYYIVRAGQD